MNLDDYEKGMTAARLDEIFTQASLMVLHRAGIPKIRNRGVQ